ncbi:TonB-dependent receptor plug domain-containing protein [Sphingopyxis sp.]|jgi:outer membrane receptor protein involved in Fe transport|uniref:TonB-dependent receptor plug domain-containing protein n=1 Tax=Sphingopyxis sp. TaxID=1908224 RepID=UPI002DF29E7E|nr:TonB-dependent receptor [Sphingopyxis sp.]
MEYRGLLQASLIALAWAGSAAPAWAQDPGSPAPATDASPETVSSDSEIVVTGSRIGRSTFDTATPVTAVSSEQLQTRAAASVSDLLVNIPAVRPNQNAAISANVGISTFDLRGLGASRTLILLNGRRLLSTSPLSGFDINSLPAQMISRVEVVTAGASSVYGSDAVSGVVNLFVDEKARGLRLEGQAGISDKGDYAQYALNATYGTTFAGGRGQLLVAGSYFTRPDILFQGSRDWGSKGYTLINNTAYTPSNGQPQLLIVPNVRLSRMTEGGLITSPGPLQYIQFGENGAQSRFTPGTNVGSIWMQGGSGLMTQPGYGAIAPASERGNVFARLGYEISPSVELFLEGLYNNSVAKLTNVPNYNNGDITIRRDNAFLPDNISQIMIANNIQSFNLGRLNSELGVNLNRTKYDYLRGVAGLQGTFSNGLKWDIAGVATRSINIATTENNRRNAAFTAGLDSVIGPDGTPICRSTLTNPANGCVAINPFGVNAISGPATAYASGTSWARTEQKGIDLTANLRGDLFTLPAGPVGFAAGLEYRRETVRVTTDPLSATGGWRQRASQPYDGKIEVKEASAELAIPLLSDTPFFQRLELDLAGRVVDYSTSGSTFVWKAGGTWAINDGIRLRATYSRDFRAPTISELFAAPVVAAGSTVTDRTTNSTVVIRTSSGGNPSLDPEVGKTFTAGVVLTPSFAPGLKFSADYYDIRISDAITNLSGQEIIDRCFAGDTALCAAVERDGAGIIQQINTSPYNATQLSTRGIDFELSYRMPVGRGTLAFSALANYVDEIIVYLNGVPQDKAGQVTSRTPAGSATVIPSAPHWRGSTTLTYTDEATTLQLLGDFIGKGKYDATYTTAILPQNNIPAYFFLGASAQFRVGDGYELFTRIDNLLDTAPPLLAENTIIRAQASVNYGVAQYDQVGRRITVGVRLKF